MKRVTVNYSKPIDMPKASLALKPVAALWPLTGGLIPVFLIWGLITYGSPALLVAEENYRCAYLDAFGGLYTNTLSSGCPWYAFRKIEVIPQDVIKTFKEGF